MSILYEIYPPLEDEEMCIPHETNLSEDDEAACIPHEMSVIYFKMMDRPSLVADVDGSRPVIPHSKENLREIPEASCFELPSPLHIHREAKINANKTLHPTATSIQFDFQAFISPRMS